MYDQLLWTAAFGILIVASVYLVLNRLLLSHERQRNIELLKSSRSITVSLRLQAYERLVLFLERISPDMLLLKLKEQAPTNADLHLAILRQIRFEYEHNISQQLYVGDRVWTRVKEAKEKTALFVNDLAKRTSPTSASVELANLILDNMMSENASPVAEVIAELKAEAKKLL